MFGQALAPAAASAPRGFFTQPKSAEWYTEREDGNAEALVRDDIPIMLIDEARAVDDSEATRLQARIDTEGIAATFSA